MSTSTIALLEGGDRNRETDRETETGKPRDIETFRPFWLIDEHRHQTGKYALLRLEKSEWKKWKLKKVFSKPTRLEFWAAWRPFLIWLITAFFSMTIVLVDWYIYLFLEKLVTASEKTIHMESKASAEIVVTGKGVVADFINNMVKVNRTTEQEEVSHSHSHCHSQFSR